MSIQQERINKVNNETLYELFNICCAIIMFAVTFTGVLGISLVCVWLIRRIVEIITGRRTNLF